MRRKDSSAQRRGGVRWNAMTTQARGRSKEWPTLLEGGADVNAPRGEWYGTALQAASDQGHDQIVQRPLEKGADVNAPEGKYGTALQMASYQGYDQIVQRLLKEGADVNASGE